MQLAKSGFQNNMVLEATVICMDNLEFVRILDYAPTRLQVSNSTKSHKFTYQLFILRRKQTRLIY